MRLGILFWFLHLVLFSTRFDQRVWENVFCFSETRVARASVKHHERNQLAAQKTTYNSFRADGSKLVSYSVYLILKGCDWRRLLFKIDSVLTGWIFIAHSVNTAVYLKLGQKLFDLLRRCADSSAFDMKYRESDSEIVLSISSRGTLISHASQSAQRRVKSNNPSFIRWR